MNLLALVAALAIGPGDDASQDLVILGETRPILIRLRVMIGDQPFRAAWLEAAHKLHAQLDRNHDGKLTVDEAEAGGLTLLGVQPGSIAKDGAISIDALAEALRANSGPFRLQAEGLEARRTDALFDLFDRDKDGLLTRPELATLVGTLRKLDRDDNELIGADEVASVEAPDVDPLAVARPGARDQAVPPAFAIVPGESPLRVIRALLKKYDKGSSRGPGKLDAKLSIEEFPIAPKAFAELDTNGDGLLNSDELRGYLEKSPRDAMIDVALSPEASGKTSARVRGLDGVAPEGLAVRQLSEGVVEIDVGLLRVDFHVEDGLGAIETARKTIKARFDAADANQDGYLEESELTQDNGQPSPLANLFKPLDRNGDGKVYPSEIDDFVTKQAEAARGRLTLSATDQGRALFGLLDLDRDRQLGAREVLETSARLSACDRDRDGRISPEEIPHHIQMTLIRGDLSALLVVPANPNAAVVATTRPTAGPAASRVPTGPIWFRKMDRNRDGDVSRREFLGTREQFDKLDRDHDGLIGPDEAEAAKPVPVKAPGG